MYHQKRLFATAAGLALLVLVAGGCIFSPDNEESGPTPPPDPPPFPGTPDVLMDNFERAYSRMDINEYEDVLHEDYKFIFIEYAEVWYRQQDIQSTSNMFAGNPGVNPEDQSTREPVQSIEIDTLIRQTPWEDVPANDEDFPNSEKALFEVRIIFTLEGGANTITVHSDQIFYVKGEEIEQDGATRTKYYLYGQQDLASEE